MRLIRVVILVIAAFLLGSAVTLFLGGSAPGAAADAVALGARTSTSHPLEERGEWLKERRGDEPQPGGPSLLPPTTGDSAPAPVPAPAPAPASAPTPAPALVPAAGRDYSRGAVEPALENRCLRPGGTARLNTTYVAVMGIWEETPEDMAWTQVLRDQGVDVLFYYKKDPAAEHILPDDTAKEDTPYLAYIVNYYDCLPPFSILLHARPWTHEAVYECLRETPLKAAERSWLPLGSDYVDRFSPPRPGTAQWNEFQDRLWERLASRGFHLPHPANKHLELYCCPQFILSRAVIRQWPREFWVAVLEYDYEVARTKRVALVPSPRPEAEAPGDWVTTPPTSWTGMALEHTFHVLFDTAFVTRFRTEHDMCQFYKPGCTTATGLTPCADARYAGSR